MILIDGRKIQKEILAGIKEKIEALAFQPVFCDILVGEDPASVQYVQMKARIAESVGISFRNASYPVSITTEELMQEIQNLNKVPNMCGIIIQLPLPETVDRQKVLNSIDPDLDIDCLGTVASDKFYGGKTEFGFPTALACMNLLDSLNLDLKNKNIVVLGQGDLVGKPVSALLGFRGLASTTISSQTPDKEELMRKADVIISGIGKGRFITGDMVKDGVVLIDAGTSESTGSIVGDVDLDSVKDKASFVSPVPGGVGPVTIAMLLSNVLSVAQKSNEH